MAIPPAKWREELTDKERSELDLAERIRDAGSEHLRNLTKRFKDRCIKRLRRKADDGTKQRRAAR